MRWSNIALAFVGLMSSVSAQADTVAYNDTETGILFQSYTDENGVSFRVALPETTDGEYDALIQIEAPADLGWVAWAWAGTMAYNPLTVVWTSGNDVIHSSRLAYGFYTPSTYPNATYTPLKGTGVTSGTLKFTALCRGCTTWQDSDGNPQTLDLSQPAGFAFALSHTTVDTPADNSSSFSIHDVVGHWNADLTAAKSADFDSWVAKNSANATNATILSRFGQLGTRH
ncbi:hypothetical protein BJ170DRAFT_593474 [Xylariales sp. AK1849]|nr:hypothetical protein BJ170DRAFT_593474 [Xylariales sp. AK1849]